MAEWEREMNELQFGNQMRNMLKPLGAMVRCPRCREKTFKVRNISFGNPIGLPCYNFSVPLYASNR
jgi:hypothetical protein